LSEREQEQDKERTERAKRRAEERREEQRNGLGATIQPTKTRQEPSRTEPTQLGCDATTQRRAIGEVA
jgi:hypothetical protein